MVMAENNSTPIETTAANTIVVPVPEVGQELTVTLDAEQIPQINFDPGTESTQEFVGNDLVFTFENGAVLVFEDFAANVNDGDVTAIMLADGTVIPIEALLAAWNLEVPETAAGAGPQGGGGSNYGDDMGDALGGIDKLGPQDPATLAAALPQAPEDEQTILPESPPIVVSISDTATTISEEGEEIDTFTISLNQAVAPGNIVTVDVSFSGTAEDADFYQAVVDAMIAEAAATPGVDFDGTTLTFTDAFVGTDFNFNVQAADDEIVESPENLVITLSNATTLIGTATAADSEDVTVVDADQNVVISITDTQETISEEGQESNTFTISLSEEIKPGNVITVKVDFDLNTDTADIDFTTPPPEATTQSAGPPSGVSFDKATGILTFTDEFVGTELSFTVQAKDDADVEGNETLTITLTDPTALNGTAAIGQGSEDVQITELAGSGHHHLDHRHQGDHLRGRHRGTAERHLHDPPQ